MTSFPFLTHSRAEGIVWNHSFPKQEAMRGNLGREPLMFLHSTKGHMLAHIPCHRPSACDSGLKGWGGYPTPQPARRDSVNKRVSCELYYFSFYVPDRGARAIPQKQAAPHRNCGSPGSTWPPASSSSSLPDQISLGSYKNTAAPAPGLEILITEVWSGACASAF